MNTKQLRQRILDLAIRGKLVPQDPNDEPASALLERVRAEKERLIKAGKIKADKKSASTDKPHYGNVPDGWSWCRLSSLATFAGGKTPAMENNDYWSGNVNWVTSKDMKSKYVYSSQIKMSELGAEQMQIFEPKTLLVVVRSGILRRTLPLAILRANSTVNQDLKAVSFYLVELCEYVYYFLSATEQEILSKYKKNGTTVESINFDEFKDMFIPLPPLAEQHRIIAAIESAFALIDEIKRGKVDLQTAVASVKSKIISLAICGKLVPQDPADEPASVLLERIRAEREALVKAGKIKRPKGETSAPICVDNSYYENLPAGWALARLGEIGTTYIGITYNPESISANGGVPVLRSNNIQNGQINYNDLISVNMDIPKRLYAQPGDILICARNGSRSLVGKSAIIEKGGMTFGAFMALYRSACNPYVQVFFCSEAFRNQLGSVNTTTINQVTQEMLKQTIIALPPFAEQSRIVTAVDTAFNRLDEIAASLS